MGIVVDAPGGCRNAHVREQFDGALPPGAPGQAEMLFEHLADLFAHGHHRIERGHRFLEDHADPVPAHPAHLPHRLAAARLAQQGEGLAAANGEVHAVHGAHGPGAMAELHAQIAHLQQDVVPAHGLCSRSRGSKASRTASANRLAESTSANIPT